jgi:hypothetical protein
VEDQIADKRRQGGGTVGLFGKADGDADAEEQRQIVEQRTACGGEHLGDLVPVQAPGTEDVVLSEPQQDAGRRQDGDGELQTAADLLQALEEAGTALLGGRRCRRGRRAHGDSSHAGESGLHQLGRPVVV